MRVLDVIEHPTFDSSTSRKDYMVVFSMAGVLAIIASTAVAMRMKGVSLPSMIDAFVPTH